MAEAFREFSETQETLLKSADVLYVAK